MVVDARNMTLGEALAGSDRFLKLPRFQRKYKWPVKGKNKDDNVTKLFDDIINNMERNSIPGKFVGSILIHDEFQFLELPRLEQQHVWDEAKRVWRKGSKRDFQGLCRTYGISGWNMNTNKDELVNLLVDKRKTNRAEIIDGQQRLTTLSLILCALKFTVLNDVYLGKSNGLRRKKIAKMCQSQLTNSDVRINLHTEDKLHFDEFLSKGFDYKPKPSKGEVIRVAVAMNKIQSRLHKKILFFSKKKDRLDWLEEFCDWLVNKIELVWVVVPDKVQAHLVFQSLNSRGLRLSLGELVNSYIQLQADLLNPTGGTLLEETTTALSTLESALDDDEKAIEGDFYYRYWLSTEGWASLAQGEILEGYISKITSIDSEAEFRSYLNNLVVEAGYYSQTMNSSISGVPDSLKDLNAIQSQHVILYMAGLRKGFSTSDWVNLTQLLELFLVRFSIAGQGKPPDQDWSDWALLINEHGSVALNGSITGSDNISSEIKAKIKDTGANEDTQFKQFMLSAQLTEAEAKFLIRSIETIGFTGNYNTKDWQAEHIAPKSHKNWNEKNGWRMTNKEKLKIKGLLGNFLILTGPENRSAGNKKWGAKKRIYSSADLPSGKHAREFAAKTKAPWTPKKIKQRTKNLSSKMPNKWPM